MRYFFTLFFLLTFFVTYSQNGLQFISNSQPKENRTQLVFLENSIKSKDILFLNFKFSIYNKLYIGDILNIKNNNEKSSISLAYKLTYNTDNKPILSLNIKGIKNLIEIEIPDDYIKFQKWMEIKIKIDYNFSQLDLTIFNQTTIIENLFEKNNSLVDITFGQNEFSENVPAFNLKDLNIVTENSIDFFPFNEKKGTIVKSLDNKTQGKITNPLWLIERYRQWKLISQLELNSNYNILYDTNEMRFILLGEDDSYELSVVSYLLNKNSYNSSSKFHSHTSGKAFINPVTKNIIMFQTGEPNIPENKFLNKKLGIKFINKDSKSNVDNTFSLGSIDQLFDSWENLYSSNISKKPLFNFTSYYDYLSNSFIVFGGYSNFKYKNEFLRFDLNKNLLEKIYFKGDNISPRYNAGISRIKNNSLLIYGGEGNLSGEKSIGTVPNNDLYKVDLSTNSINLLWNLKTTLKKNSISENLIINSSEDFFYCLFNNGKDETIGLKKISVENGDEVFLGNTINFNTSIIANNFNLYFEEKNNRLYAYTKEFKDNRLENNIISFYSIKMEPVSTITEIEPKSDLESSQLYGYIKWLGLILFVVISLIFIILKFRKPKIKLIENSTKKDYIFVRSNRSDVKLFFNNVIALEAVKDYTKLITKENNYVVHGNISNFIKKFPKTKFVRIHRSTIINIDFISSFQGDTVNLGRKHYTIGGKYISDIKNYIN